MTILGIDPGLDGGLVLLDGTALRERAPMPTVAVRRGKANRREYDVAALLRWMRAAEHVVIERSMPMPGQGVTSTFSTGMGFGLLCGLAAGLGVPHTIISPQTWQRVMLLGAGGGNTKGAAYIVCQRLWPGADWRATERCRKPHDGLCDAALIGEYGRRVLAVEE